MSDLLITNIGQLVTNAPGSPDLVGVISEAAVAVANGRVAWAGPGAELPGRYSGLTSLDVEGRAVIPGFVDPHTHLVFGGDRADEFARRLRGETYQQATAAGGGIHSTVSATRAAARDELVAGAAERAARLLASGTTTVEVKSGYGLDVETELRMLEAAAELPRRIPIDVSLTFLGAHLVPEEYGDDREGFLRLVEEDMLPACAPLARWCDVFCDEGAFTPEESKRVLQAGTRNGLRPRIHANELASSGGVEVAVQTAAASADHLAYLSDGEIAALSAAGVAAVLLPATVFSLQSHRYPRAADLFEAGVTVALGTDCNPGTSYTEAMPFVIALACIEMGLTPEQALWAATRGGAIALEEEDKGWVGPGTAGDLVVLNAPSYEHLPYRPATHLAWRVVKDGSIVAGDGSLVAPRA